MDSETLNAQLEYLYQLNTLPHSLPTPHHKLHHDENGKLVAIWILERINRVKDLLV